MKFIEIFLKTFWIFWVTLLPGEQHNLSAYAVSSSIPARLVKGQVKKGICTIKLDGKLAPHIKTAKLIYSGQTIFIADRLGPISKKNEMIMTGQWRVGERLRQHLIKQKPKIVLKEIFPKKPTSFKSLAAKQLEVKAGPIDRERFSLSSTPIVIIGITLMALFAFMQLKKRRKGYDVAIEKYVKTIERDQHLPSTLHPIINPALCGGCGACVRACPEGQILQLIDHKAVLVKPTSCVGHGLCEKTCPYEAIELVFGSAEKAKEIPDLDDHYQSNVDGLYITGELGGMGLITNAVRQGHLATSHAFEKLCGKNETKYQILIVGAGPAGLSAACTAQQLGVSYLCIEQGSFGGTITNFPRGKVVMQHQVEFAGYGKTKYPRNKISKEQLIDTWMDIRQKQNLRIQEQTRFDSLSIKDGFFEVETNQGPITAEKVILATGVSGTPRKLDLEGEDSNKVFYRLIEPDEFQNKNIAIVGGGNSATEAAAILSDPELGNNVSLLVRKDMSKAHEENQDIVNKLVDSGQLSLHLKSSIKEITESHITIECEGQTKILENDCIFVFAGSKLPWGFLESIGVNIRFLKGQSKRWEYTPEDDHKKFTG